MKPQVPCNRDKQGGVMKFEKEWDKHEVNYGLRDEDGGLIATVFFTNGQFDRVWFGFKGTYSREQWRILALIERQISKIEKSHK